MRRRSSANRNPCPHGKLKHNCVDCNPCPHGNLKKNCVDCNPCPHGKLKHNCVDCKPCPHGKLKHNCKECMPCPHGKLKHNCKECILNPTRLDAPSASGANAGEHEPTHEADDAAPPPPSPPPAEETRAARDPSAAAAAAAEPAEEAEAPAPSAPASTSAASQPEVPPRDRLLYLVRERQLARDVATWRIASALDPDRPPDPDPELAALSPEAEVTLEAKNLFVRHRVSTLRAPSGYLVSAALSARPDESAREETRPKPIDWPLERDWTLALNERDDATPSADAKASGAGAGAAAASKGARAKTVTFVSLVSNVECEPAEVDAWVARRFSGDVDKALAWIEAAPIPGTARKRPAKAAPSGAPATKKRAGVGKDDATSGDVV